MSSDIKRVLMPLTLIGTVGGNRTLKDRLEICRFTVKLRLHVGDLPQKVDRAQRPSL
jgi:hypothetical protein